MAHPPFHLYTDAQFASPYAMSVFVTLREKRLPFDLSTVDLANKANYATDYAARSLTRRVPTLIHEDLMLNGDPVPHKLKEYATQQWQRASVQQWAQLERPPL
ncbi:glutathione S-transferase N-terminal domain-containing protein [Paraburkholderia sp. 31.1]|uniref:glutathione S-transferase N-terminal domain-containing protein n=1 Tax=Paraburkholderia sp. 31.1 TaxID=2615205 RepID=UPI0039750DCA